MLDLHNHSTASDGALSPAALVARAAGRGVGTLALTDHDTVAGLAEARAAGDAHGVRVVSGIEISATRKDGGSLHILGYLFDESAPALADALGRLVDGRRGRNEALAARLAELGMPVDLGAIRAAAGGSVGRPHFARAMIDAGYVRSNQEAFSRWLKDGRPAHVTRSVLRAEAAIAAIHAAGGVAVLAHPMAYGFGVQRIERVVARLANAGLDGLEVYYPGHTEGQRVMLRCFADRYGLVSTGGSDYHGGEGVAQPDVPSGALSALEDRRAARLRAASS